MGTVLGTQTPRYTRDLELSEDLRAILKDLGTLYISKRSLKPKKVSELGQGGFGDVFLAQLKDSNGKWTNVAVKQLRPVGTKGDRTRLATRLARELRVWAKLNHPNVLGLLGFYLSDDYKVAQFVSIYLPNGNVSQYIERYDPGTKTRFKFIKDITSGMRYLHEHDPPICHGDLKPANVLISDNVDAVLCDFGLAAFADGPSGMTTTRAVKGSVRYMSPELFHENEDECQRTLSSDVWAWACTTYEITTDLKPYSDYTGDNQTMAALLQGVGPGTTEQMLRRIPQDNMWPEKVLLMFGDCWSFTPKQRPTMRTLFEACEAPPSEAIDLSGQTVVVDDGTRLAKRSATLGSDASTLFPGRPLPASQSLSVAQNSDQPGLKPTPSPSIRDPLLLAPGVYRVSFIFDEEKDTSQYLCHGGYEQPISMSAETEDPQAEEWVFTPKPGAATQYAIFNVLSGQYLGFVEGQVEATSVILWWTLESDGMGFTISVDNMSIAARARADGADVVMEEASTDRRRWSITPTAEKTYGPYWIKHKETQNYLSLQNGDYNDNTPALGFRGTTRRKADLSFQWRVIPTGEKGSDLVRIQNVASGTCLMSHGEPVDGAVQISGWADAEHTWLAKPAPGEPTAKIFHVESSVFVAELYAGSPFDGTNAVVWPFKEGNPRQVWYLEPTRP